MFRLLTIVVLSFAAVIWVEPRWSSKDRTLNLRLREGAEIVAFVREQARLLGERVVQAAGEKGKTPPVGAPPAKPASASDQLTTEDRNALDRLIERKLRESEPHAAQGAD